MSRNIMFFLYFLYRYTSVSGDYLTTSAPKPAFESAAISTELLTLLLTTTVLSGIETETISTSPSTLPSADRTSWAQPPQSIPDTANLISSACVAQPMKNTTVSNNTTNEKRITDIKITPLLSSNGAHDVKRGHHRDG